MRRKPAIRLERLEEKTLLSTTAGLVGSIVATPTTTSAGTSVELSFTETNESTHPISVTYGPVDDGFAVTMAGKTVWTSNAGPQPQFLELKTLAPGAVDHRQRDVGRPFQLRERNGRADREGDLQGLERIEPFRDNKRDRRRASRTSAEAGARWPPCTLS